MAKICIVGPSVKYFSGISAYTIQLANALSTSNSVSVVLFRNLLPRFLYPGKYNVGRMDYLINFAPNIRTFEGLDWNSPISWTRTYRFLRREAPDVIIMQWWTSSVAHLELLLVLVNKLRTRAHLILEMHEILDPLEAGNPVFRVYSNLMGKLIMAGTDAFVVHSTSVKEQAVQVYRLQDDRVFVIPHGIYDNYFQECRQEDSRKELGIKEEFVVLYFGMIRKYKGIPCLVEAFNQLPQNVAAKSRLIIAGEDWGDEKELETLIKSSPYNRQISFKPEFVPESSIPRYFSAADTVVLPYLRTAGSGVASLAMAFHKPIIISNLEGIQESLKEYPGALFVPVGDASSIAAKLFGIYLQQQTGHVKAYEIPPGHRWQYITRQYEQMISQISTTAK